METTLHIKKRLKRKKLIRIAGGLCMLTGLNIQFTPHFFTIGCKSARMARPALSSLLICKQEQQKYSVLGIERTKIEIIFNERLHLYKKNKRKERNKEMGTQHNKYEEIHLFHRIKGSHG